MSDVEEVEETAEEEIREQVFAETTIHPINGVLFNSEEFDNMDGWIARAIKEANFICGYKKYFSLWVEDPDDLEEGLAIVRKAYNVRANLYRWRDIRATKAAEFFKCEDQSKSAELHKELMEIADRLLIYGFEIIRLRLPIRTYLATYSLYERPRKRMKEGAVMTYDED